MPQAPQLKVTIRKIQDLERFGSVAQILEMVATIIKNTNEESKNKPMFLPIVLDENSIRLLVEQEKLVKEAVAKRAAEEEEEEEEVQVVEELKEQDGDVVMEEKVEEEVKDVKPEAKPEAEKFASVVKGQQPQQESIEGPFISARALYVVPPKKSRRRGIKSGCAYLVLNGPRVAETEEEYASLTQLEKSRATAKARLQLFTAVEALSKHGEEDAKSPDEQQHYGGCLIQQSMSGKAWKSNYRDNRENTIETTADYKRFMAKTEKEEEERMSRPRPTPGGAMPGDLESAENGEPVAAIVKHLQAKHKQEARRRKASMKKNASADPNKGKKKGSSSKDEAAKSNNRGGRAKQERKKKGKKKSGAPKPPPMPAPAMMSTTDFPTL
jgi:hypothetical protein